MIWFIIVLFICYTILIISLTFGFIKMKEFKEKDTKEQTAFSVIIPFRNEAKNLPNLFKSISELNYSHDLVEFIFVDDASSDNSVELIKKFIPNIGMVTKVIKNKRTSNSPKKDAISTAISIAKNNWIITSDADCILPQKWLKKFNSFIKENNPNMVVGLVNYKAKNNFLEQFQLLDFMSMQGSTIGGFGINFPFLCNGANLAYKKDAFIRLNGFEGNNTMASGDDIFLFEKFIEDDKKSVHILKSKEATVTTFPTKTWSKLINQRTRWAAKTNNLKSINVKIIGLIIILVNAFIIVNFFGFTIQINSYKNLLFLLGLKLTIDLFLFVPTIRFYKNEKTFLIWYIFSSLFYPFFSVLIIFNSLFFEYNWKGRRFKK